MKVQEVLEKATRDPQYARQLRARAVAFAAKGVMSPEFDQFMQEFAATPQELARLKAIQASARGTTTITTITTTTTVACTFTTTTTTTTDA